MEVPKSILDIKVTADVICPHPKKILRVLDTFCEVEVTEVYCPKCGEILREKEWEV